MITGKDIIDLGYKPSKWFSKAISYANNNGLGVDALRLYIDEEIISKEPKQIPPRDTPISFHKNIVAETQAEKSNLDSVCAAMNNILTIPTAVDAAIMPDACPTGPNDIPVGGVVITKNAIHPAMHSADICCSVMLSNFGKTDPKIVLDAAHSKCHFGPGGRLERTKLVKELETKIYNNSLLNTQKGIEYAEYHMGSAGGGNHFIFVGRKKSNGDTVLVTHYGSRGLGAYLYKKIFKIAEKFRQEISPKLHKNLAFVPMDTPEGVEYWDALQTIRLWTKYNHLYIHEKIAVASNSEVYENYWNEHNFVFKDGYTYIHAKGSTPLLDKYVPDSTNGLRLIPMNMRDGILIVRGEETETNLGFAPHGSGRNYSRAEHSKIALQNKNGNQLFEEETLGLDIRFFSGKIDITELPSAYKDANKVKEQIKKFNLGKIIDEVDPYGCIMDGHSKPNYRKKNKSS